MRLNKWIGGILLVLSLGLFGHGAAAEEVKLEPLEVLASTASSIRMEAVTGTGITLGGIDVPRMTESGVTLPSVAMGHSTNAGLTLQGIQIDGLPNRLIMGLTYQGILVKTPTAAGIDSIYWWGRYPSPTAGGIQVTYDGQIQGIRLGLAEVHVSASAFGIGYEATKYVDVVPEVFGAEGLTQGGINWGYVAPNQCKVYEIKVPTGGSLVEMFTTGSSIGLYGVLYDENLNVIDRQMSDAAPGTMHFRQGLSAGRYYIAIGSNQPYAGTSFALLYHEETAPVTPSGITLVFGNQELYHISDGGIRMVEMPVLVSGIPSEGLAGYQLDIRYNPYDLEFRGVTTGAVGYPLALTSYSPTPGSIRIASTHGNISQGAIVADGELLKFLFEVKAKQEEFWTYVSATEYGNQMFLDRYLNELSYAISGGSIHFRSVQYGDVNGDGMIDSRDVALIREHIVGSTMLSNTQRQGADVNGDGQVNVKDAAMIQQYVEGIIGRFPVEL